MLSNFEPEIETITLIPAQGGRFEVDVNEVLLYSKLHTGRHAQAGEVVGLVKEYLMKRG